MCRCEKKPLKSNVVDSYNTKFSNDEYDVKPRRVQKSTELNSRSVTGWLGINETRLAIYRTECLRVSATLWYFLSIPACRQIGIWYLFNSFVAIVDIVIIVVVEIVAGFTSVNVITTRIKVTE